MGSGKDLSKEKITILAYHKTGMSGNKIVSKIGKSSRAIHKFLEHQKTKRSKRHPKMTSRDKRNLKRMALNSSLSAKEIKTL